MEMMEVAEQGLLSSANASTQPVASTSGMSSVPSARPELGTVSFTAAKCANTEADVDEMLKTLLSCKPAIKVLQTHERDMQHDGLIAETHKPLTNLEKNLRSASKYGCCERIFCATLFKHGDLQFARVFEDGSMKGASTDETVRSKIAERFFESTDFFSYKTFSCMDLEAKEQGDKPELGTNYSRKAKEVKNHVQRLVHEAEGTCLKGIVVYLMKQRSRKNMKIETLFLVHWEGSTEADTDLALEEALRDFGTRNAGLNYEEENLSTLYKWNVQAEQLNEASGQASPFNQASNSSQPPSQASSSSQQPSQASSSSQQPSQPPSIQKQLDALGGLSHSEENICWVLDGNKTVNKGKIEIKFYQRYFVNVKEMPKHKIPYTLRSRLCHFVLTDELPQARQLLRHHFFPHLIDSAVKERGISSTDVQSATKRRRLNTEGPQEQQTGLNVQEPDVPGHDKPVVNQASTLSVYETFRMNVISHGKIKWISHQEKKDEFVVNDYSQASELQADQFVMVEVFEGVEGKEVRCKCKQFRLYGPRIGEKTCMHKTLFQEMIIPQFRIVMEVGFKPVTAIQHKLHQAWTERSESVWEMSKSSQVVKFCVRPQKGSACFVNLQADGSSVRCKSGKCHSKQVTTKKLQNLASARSLCPHLQVFRAEEYKWQYILKTDHGEERLDEEESEWFDANTGLWNFNGHSQHKPSEEGSDIYKRNYRERKRLCIDLERAGKVDNDGNLTGHILQPPVPDSCLCGAPIKCQVMRRWCRKGKEEGCKVEYNPESDGIFFWSRETCIADEVGYYCLYLMFDGTQCTFLNFCKNMNKDYSSWLSPHAKFVSVTTFIRWFFSWMAASRIDFRKEVDPWCGHSPDILACDGTHTGVRLQRLSVTPIEKPNDEAVCIKTVHKRYNRTFLFEAFDVSDRETKENQETRRKLRQARENLHKLCEAALDEEDVREVISMENFRNLVDLCGDQRAKNVVEGLFTDRYANSKDLQLAVAEMLSVLASDNPLSAALPYDNIQTVQRCVAELQRQPPSLVTLNSLRKVEPEVYNLLEAARITDHKTEMCNLVSYLCHRVLKVHQRDVATIIPENDEGIPGTYNPPSGVAYYFSPKGQQMRPLRKCDIDGRNNDGDDDDRQQGEECRKIYPHVSQKGYCYVFLWFCPTHGHCYGFHLIPAAEGRKDPFASLLKYKKEAPNVIFYDNACQLAEYSLNREPAFFRKTRFFHDCFHGYAHKCAKTFSSEDRFDSCDPNTSICEQFNVWLKNIKRTAVHLSQERFIFLLQYAIYRWNQHKTVEFRKKEDARLREQQ